LSSGKFVLLRSESLKVQQNLSAGDFRTPNPIYDAPLDIYYESLWNPENFKMTPGVPVVSILNTYLKISLII